MKNKVLFWALCLVTLTSYVANAQTFTAKAGFNLADMNIKVDGVSPDLDLKPGFHVGVAADMPLNSLFSIEPAVLYTTKGYKYSGILQGTSSEVHTNLQYLDIPVNFKVATQTKGGFRVFAAAGPYMGIGLAGKFKAKVSGQGINEDITEKVEWGTEDNDFFKRFEYGATFGAGVEVKQIQIGLSYDLGLTDISANSYSGESMKNRVLKISVGWMFGKK